MDPIDRLPLLKAVVEDGGPEETKVRYLLPGSLSARSLWHGYVPNQRLQLLLECPLLCLPGF